MNCSEVNELISLYIDNELNEKERADFEEHLQSCETCRREVEEITRLVQACGGIEEEELPEGFKEELHVKLVAADAGENAEKKLLIFPLKKIRMFVSIAAGFVVVVLAALLFRAMLLTPSKTESSANDMLAENQQKSAAKSGEYSGSAQNSGTADAKNSESVEKSKIDASDNDNNVAMQYDISTRSKDSGTETKAASGTKATVSKAAAGTTSASKPETESAVGGETAGMAGGGGSESQPRCSLTATALPEKRTASILIYSSDTDKTIESLEKLVLDNDGEKIVRDAGTAETTTVTQPAVSEQVIEYKIPNLQYEAFKQAAVAAFGQDNVEASELVKEDLSATLEDLTKQSEKLDIEIKKAEDGEIQLTSDELAKLKEEKSSIDAKLGEVSLQTHFTYITCTIKNR